MAVVADFTADVVSGCSPLTVTFTDTSTGFPTNWLWDFGDGILSSDQHPVHIYDIEDGNYTVELLAWDESATVDVTGSLVNRERKFGSHASNYDIAYANFLAASWVSSGSTQQRYLARHQVTGVKEVEGGRGDLAFFLSAYGSGKILTLYGRYETLTGEAESESIFNNEIVFPNPSGHAQTLIKNVTAEGGTTFIVNFIDNNGYAKLSAPAFGQVDGWNILNGAIDTIVRVSTYITQDTEIKTNYISIGAPVANFSLDPSSGPSPLSVDFTNLSGSGFTYSWQRRVSGSEDDFVEFSTLENPTGIIFTK
jgi:PKD repeat protein